jgi:hypothetical protein
MAFCATSVWATELITRGDVVVSIFVSLRDTRDPMFDRQRRSASGAVRYDRQRCAANRVRL